MTLTEALSQLAVETPTDAIAESAFAAARTMTLDALACALAGWDAPGVAEVVEQMRDWGGAEEASLLVRGWRLPAPNAAFSNSAMIHALDYDDVHIPGSLHITSVVVPAILAAGEMADAGGRQALEAIILGVEVAGRLAIARRNVATHAHAWHWLPTSVFGGFGAVAAAARLLGLSIEQCANAMGLNYAQTSGNRQALHDRTLTKRLQPGFAARSALWAAALAARGITGPRGALDGEGNIFRVYHGAEPPALEEVMAERPQWEIERVSVKRHTSCGSCHPPLHAAERLREEEALSPHEIDRVEIFGHREGGFVSKPFELGDDPQVSAQFSVRYCVAYALLRGRQRLEDWTDEAIRADEEVADLARAIEFVDVPDDVPEPLTPPADFSPYTTKWQGVIVHTTDGRRLMRAECPARVFAPAAVSEAEVVAKFRQCAQFSRLCDDDATDGLVACLAALTTDRPLRETMRPWWSLTR